MHVCVFEIVSAPLLLPLCVCSRLCVHLYLCVCMPVCVWGGGGGGAGDGLCMHPDDRSSAV